MIPPLVRSRTRLHYKSFLNISGNVDDSLAGIDLQILIQHEMDVVRQQFFAARFLAQGLETSCAHLQLVRGGKHCAADRVEANGIGDGALFDHQVIQPFTCSYVRSRQSCWSSPDNQQIQLLFVTHLNAQNVTSPWATTTDGPPTRTCVIAPGAPVTSRLIRLGRLMKSPCSITKEYLPSTGSTPDA